VSNGIYNSNKIKLLTGNWKKLHYEELYDQNSSPNIIHVIIRPDGHVVRVVEERFIQGFGGETPPKKTIWKTYA
jgi:hypothetical protein